MTKDEILKKLKDIKPDLEMEFHITKLALFGSYARNEAKKESDIDLLFEIEKDSKFTLFGFAKMKSQLEDIFKIKVDLVKENGLKERLKKYVYKDVVYV